MFGNLPAKLWQGDAKSGQDYQDGAMPGQGKGANVLLWTNLEVPQQRSENAGQQESAASDSDVNIPQVPRF